MKSIFANQQHINWFKKIRVGWLVLRENGVIWTLCLGVYCVCSLLSESAFARMNARAQRKGLPGISSRSINKEIWEDWDWQAGGEEWTLSPEWKESLLRHVLHPYMPAGKCILEIGTGAGRWTEHLQQKAAQLIGVDISEKCIAVCRQKFERCGNVRFLLTQGSSLAGIDDQSVDAIWSYDVFVHINAEDAAGYVQEFRRVLRPGGIGVVHHALKRSPGGWRSNLTAERFKQLIEQNGLKVSAQFDHWLDNGRTMPAGAHEDVITVFHH